jgi:heme/copper-type cytochrome/quinol oxidase subunit 3
MSATMNEHLESGVTPEQASMPTATGLDSRKMGIWMFIASEVIFFTALISTYLLYRGYTPREQGLAHLELNVAAVMTFILLMSSFTMVSALAAIRDGKPQQMRLWLAATAALGLFFLGSQAFEWSLLFREGITPATNLFGATFFTTTGFHGTHVFVGVLWILGVLVRALRGGVTPRNNLSVEMVGLYWHFVDLVWVVLFTVIYLI